MVRRSKEEKAKSRQDIIAAAATLFRERGIENTSVADVMKEAGFTHGGFYRHFSNKEELAAAAITEAFSSGLRVFSGDAENPEIEALSYVDKYLSDEHIDTAGDGCPIQLLGSEAARGADIWQSAIIEGATSAINGLALGLQGNDREATKLLALLVGTVVLARSVGRGPLRDEILKVGRDAAKSLLGGKGSGPDS